MPLLKLSAAHLIASLKRLAPKRVTVAMKSGEIYIGKLDNEVVFSLIGAQTRCPFIECDWDGFAVVKFGMLASFLKAPPTKETVLLSYTSDRLKIDTLSMTAKWVSAPDWIAAMASEAHLMADVESKTLLYCPRCGKCKGEPVDPIARQWPAGLPVASQLKSDHANMECTACKHKWCEVAN